MQNLLVFLATAEPSPGGDLREGLDPEMVTPGTLGFLATLFVVIATVFLIRDMSKRVRRVRYREQVQRQADERGAADGGESDDGVPDDETPAAGAAHGSSEGSVTGDLSDAGDSTGAADSPDSGTSSDNGSGGESAAGGAHRLKKSNGAGPDRKG